MAPEELEAILFEASQAFTVAYAPVAARAPPLLTVIEPVLGTALVVLNSSAPALICVPPE